MVLTPLISEVEADSLASLKIRTVAVTSAGRRSYYVATTGNDSNPSSESQPFRSINRRVSELTPGDTLFVRGGTYAAGPVPVARRGATPSLSPRSPASQ